MLSALTSIGERLMLQVDIKDVAICEGVFMSGPFAFPPIVYFDEREPNTH